MEFTTLIPNDFAGIVLMFAGTELAEIFGRTWAGVGEEMDFYTS
jgi:hypothetical protein